SAGPREQRAGRVPALQQADPDRLPQERRGPLGPDLPQVRRGRLRARGQTMTTATAETRALPRLKQRYRDEIVAQLREQFGYSNVMQVPTLVKIKVNMGVGEAARDGKLIEGAVRDLTAITGQRPAIARARVSIAQFKLREGMP